MLATVVLASIMAGAVVSLLHAIRAGDRTKEVMSKIGVFWNKATPAYEL